MGPTSSPEPGRAPSSARDAILEVARQGVAYAVRHGAPMPIDPELHPPELRRPGATFVTLRRAGKLRGCVGSLEAQHPLVVDLAENAFRAACADGRFPPLREDELADLEVHVSVLSPLERLEVASEKELLERLRPGVDGLVLTDGSHRGTFLPEVWRSLPDPRAFVRELKRKAGLPLDHWSDTLRIDRYTVDSIP